MFICAALASALFSAPGKAAGPFDGIYTAVFQNTLIGYVTIHENNGSLVVAVLETQLTWNAFSGLRSGSNFSVTSISGAGAIAAQYSGTFTSGTTYRATQISCVPLSENCALPNGAIITGDKIF